MQLNRKHFGKLTFIWSEAVNKYIYQKFLLNCDYEKINISDIPYFVGDIDKVMDFTVGYCLFDVDNLIIRKIDVNYLDEHVDTEDDWKLITTAIQSVDVIILCNCDIIYENPIVHRYREATVKSYLTRLLELNKKVYRT